MGHANSHNERLATVCLKTVPTPDHETRARQYFSNCRPIPQAWTMYNTQRWCPYGASRTSLVVT